MKIFANLQEVFDAAYIGLAKQGFVRSVWGGGCAYRGADGLACAIGHCVPDSMVKKSQNGLWIQSMIETDVMWAERFSKIDVNDLQRLQDCHDGGTFPQKMKANLEQFALSNELTIPEIPHEGA